MKSLPYSSVVSILSRTLLAILATIALVGCGGTGGGGGDSLVGKYFWGTLDGQGDYAEVIGSGPCLFTFDSEGNINALSYCNGGNLKVLGTTNEAIIRFPNAAILVGTYHRQLNGGGGSFQVKVNDSPLCEASGTLFAIGELGDQHIEPPSGAYHGTFTQLVKAESLIGDFGTESATIDGTGHLDITFNNPSGNYFHAHLQGDLESDGTLQNAELDIAGSVQLFDAPPQWSFDGTQLVVRSYNGSSESDHVLTLGN